MKILTEKEAKKVEKKCSKIYELTGQSEVYEHADKVGLDYSYCDPCEDETPTIATEKTSCCAVCGTWK